MKKWGVAGNVPAAVIIVTTPATALGDMTALTADLVLSPEFLGQDESTHLSFVGLDITGGADAIAFEDIYRVTTAKTDLGKNVPIQSVDYDGTNLVAGAAADNQVYRSADPTVTAPTISTATTNKRPGGTGQTTKVVTRFAEDTVVAGTTGDMSAFSVSSDLGKTFTDVSLIDINTAADKITSLAMNDDASVIYMAMEDGVGASVWRQASAWQRVLAKDGLAGLLIELAPEDADTIYVADKGTDDLWVSQEGGDTKWFIRTAPADIADFAVESADTIYVLKADDTVYKSINTGFTFGAGVDGKMGVGHSLTSLGEDLLIAGGTGGEIAYSANGGTSFTELDKEAMTTDGGLIVATATGLETGDFIFAATDDVTNHIYRWEIGQAGTTWKEIADLNADESVYGLAMRGGVLYATVDDTTDSWLYRSLNPTAATPEFSTHTSAAERFNVAPQNIWVTSGSTKVFAIDTAGDTVFSYTDTTVSTGPTQSAPAHQSIVPINTATGGAYDITFTWARLSLAATYDLDISTNVDFTETVVDLNGIGSTAAYQALVVGPNGPNAAQTFNFLPDTTYYWRVRAATPVVSPWSAWSNFTIAALPEAFAPVVIEPAPTPEITVTVPDITITQPDVVVNVPAPTEVVLPPAQDAVSPIPSWALIVIIAIGAILVVAVVILIVRTRRVV